MRSLEDRIELAEAFVYTADQRDEIVALMQPLKDAFRVLYKPALDERRNDVGSIPASPQEACIYAVTTMARDCLGNYLKPYDAKSEKARLDGIA